MDDLRSEMLAKRRMMTAEDRAEKNGKIFQNVISTAEFINAERIFCYINMPVEAETAKIIDYALEFSKRVFAPVTDKNDMFFAEIKDLFDLKKSSFGVLEPKNGTKIEPKDGDLFIIPGSVFDIKGHRYGYGKGFYDRYLSRYDVIKMALCYDFQLLESIKIEKHDINMDIIVTDKEILKVEG